MLKNILKMWNLIHRLLRKYHLLEGKVIIKLIILILILKVNYRINKR